MPAADHPSTTSQDIGSSGVQPKNRLSPGVWTTAKRTASEPAAVARTSGLRRPAHAVCPSWVPISAASPIVLARPNGPVNRPVAQAPVAPTVVAAPRTSTLRRTASVNPRCGPASSTDASG